MTEKELRPSPEREVTPISIELTTTRDQEAMLAIADRSLYAGTIEEIRGGGVGDVRVENNVWRPIFRQLANNLGRTYELKELLMRGIIDDIPLQTLEQWAKGKGQLSLREKDVITWRAKYFVKQKRQAIKKEQK
jgi:hypothetical protein